MREAVVMQMTWPGAPTIYYGDEAGVCGFTDPDNRRTYPWGKEDQELIRFHKEMIRIHKACRELLTGSLKIMSGDYNLISYGRFNRQAQTIVVVNNNDHEVSKDLTVWYLGIPKESTMKCLMLTEKDGFSTEEVEYTVSGGKVYLVMPPISAIVLRHENLVPSQKKKKFFSFDVIS